MVLRLKLYPSARKSRSVSSKCGMAPRWSPWTVPCCRARLLLRLGDVCAVATPQQQSSARSSFHTVELAFARCVPRDPLSKSRSGERAQEVYRRKFPGLRAIESLHLCPPQILGYAGTSRADETCEKVTECTLQLRLLRPRHSQLAQQHRSPMITTGRPLSGFPVFVRRNKLFGMIVRREGMDQ